MTPSNSDPTEAILLRASGYPDMEQGTACTQSSFRVGKGGWVTARFSAEAPLPTALWKRWLDESHALAGGGAPARPRKKA